MAQLGNAHSAGSGALVQFLVESMHQILVESMHQILVKSMHQIWVESMHQILVESMHQIARLGKSGQQDWEEVGRGNYPGAITGRVG